MSATARIPTQPRHAYFEGLPQIHDLRHTAASLAISCDGNVLAVQRMLGHKDASVTLNRYGHLYNDDLITLASAMEEKYLVA